MTRDNKHKFPNEDHALPRSALPLRKAYVAMAPNTTGARVSREKAPVLSTSTKGKRFPPVK
jgi:hypothetical protein